MMKKRRNIMQNDSIDNLRLDLNKKSVRGVIYVRAGDTRARTVHITLTSNGTVVDLSDAYICEIFIRKPDGGNNDQAFDMNEQAMVRYGNELQYTFRTKDIDVPGECKCQVMVTFNDGAVITSPEFSVMVYQKTIDQDLEKSTNEYTALTQQVIDVTELRNQTAQDADRAETAREGVESYEEICKQYADSAAESAEAAEEAVASVPTKLSDFTNDCGFIDKTVDDLVNYYTQSQTFTKAEVNALIAAINEFNIEFVQTLPLVDIDTHTIYFLAKQTPEQNDYYDEYVNTNGTAAGWEKIGSTQVDLSQYYTKTEVDALLEDVSGGHVIEDSEGASVAQEDTMQFADAHVTDDATNGRTVVENIKEHTTKADYDQATEDGIHVIDDGNDALIGAVSDDYVEVTASSDTYMTALNKLRKEADFDKITKESYIKLGNNVYIVTALLNNEIYFSSVLGYAGSGGSNIQTIFMPKSGVGNCSFQECVFTSSISRTNKDASSVTDGTKITLYYGNKKATVDLQTTANRCLYDSNTTVKQKIDTNDANVIKHHPNLPMLYMGYDTVGHRLLIYDSNQSYIGSVSVT
jgi:hypothetical protein